MKNFRDLVVWQKAHALTLMVYQITKKFPKDELYGLTSQMRRASSSIAANIAEGCGKRTDADFGRFLQNAFGSANELEYHAILAHDLDLLNSSDYQQLNEQTVEVKKMLAGLLRKLNADR
ncbi:MAG: four helix bundle protein [Ignavibacteriales bacterium]|nr:four helix bundle protein [Ignavibacteriales bacterium]